MLDILYHWLEPSDEILKANTTVVAGQLAVRESDGQLGLFDGNPAQVDGLFLEGTVDITSPERAIRVVAGHLRVRTDIFVGSMSNYTILNPVYADTATGKITYSNAGSNVRIGQVVGKETAAIIVELFLPTTYNAHNHVFTGDALTAHGHNVEMVVEEAVTVSTDQGTLANVPVGVPVVFGTVGATPTKFVVISESAALATGQVKVNYTTGVLTFFADDDPTGVKVTYAKKAVSTTSAGTPAGTIA